MVSVCGDAFFLVCLERVGKPLDEICKACLPSNFRKRVLRGTYELRQSVFARVSRRSIQQIVFFFNFCLTVHHKLGKVIQKNQLDATMIY